MAVEAMIVTATRPMTTCVFPISRSILLVSFIYKPQMAVGAARRTGR
jgi:hypothetical protein